MKLSVLPTLTTELRPRLQQCSALLTHGGNKRHAALLAKPRAWGV